MNKPRVIEMIERPVTSDGLAGYDQFNQFMVFRRDESGFTGTIKADLRGSSCPLCSMLWIATSASLVDQHFARETNQHVHRSCFVRYETFRQRAELLLNLIKAGFYDVELLELPNGYYLDEWATPWYKVNIKDSNRIFITCGPRKNVYSLEFEKLTIDENAQLQEAFKSEDVTKLCRDDGAFMIHAWTREKVVEYLTTFARVCMQVA
jgi:hypothetical protein